MKRLLLTMAFVLLTVSIALAANTVTFRWDANTEGDLARYKLYQAEVAGGPYIKAQVIGEGSLVAIIVVDLAAVPPAHPTEYTLENVADGEYFWVLTAADLATNESDFSNEVSAILDSSAPGAPVILNITAVVSAP